MNEIFYSFEIKYQLKNKKMLKGSIQFYTILLIAVTLSFSACKNTPTEVDPPNIEVVEDQLEWTKDKVIYEVNLRQYSESGSFNDFTADLPRLKDIGVDILWFMPIHPISKAKRKGTLGSYYAVADYKDVNPEHGTKADFKALVDKAHEMGMYVIIDWVPNHSGWDHKWITEHPEYYTKNDKGEIIDPIEPATGKSWGWTDVADLNYDNQEMRAAMIDAMRFWITDFDIDGYRCDVAHGVPQDFWIACIDSLKATDPEIFMLAEAEIPRLRNSAGFETTYAWNFKNVINAIGEGTMNGDSIDVYLQKDRADYKKGYHMYFTTNHDENAWEGTVFERLGDGHKALAVLASTFDGMPLLYSGQESAMNKRLKFFEKDPIEWGDYVYTDFYKTLFSLKKANQALWNGGYGGEPIKIKTGNPNTYAYVREKNGDKVVVILNLSKEEQAITLSGNDFAGDYTDIFMKQKKTVADGEKMTLAPWQYTVLSNK